MPCCTSDPVWWAGLISPCVSLCCTGTMKGLTSNPVSVWLISDCTVLCSLTDESGDSDDGELSIEDNVTMAKFKPQSFSLETKANVAMDMDSVIQYFEDDEYPLEDMFGEYKSDSGSSTDHDEADYESDWASGSLSGPAFMLIYITSSSYYVHYWCTTILPCPPNMRLQSVKSCFADAWTLLRQQSQVKKSWKTSYIHFDPTVSISISCIPT